MVEVIRHLHREFVELIAGRAMSDWWFDGDWARQNLAITNEAKSSPTFFLDGVGEPSEAEASSTQLITELFLPFPSFWLAYRWKDANVQCSDFAFFDRREGAEETKAEDMGAVRGTQGAAAGA